MRKISLFFVLFILIGGVIASGCLGGGNHADRGGTQTQDKNTSAGGSVEKNTTSTATNTATNTLSEEEIEKKVDEWMKYNYMLIKVKDAWGGDYYIIPVQTSHKLAFTYEYNITTADGVVGNVNVAVKYYKYGYLIRYNVTIHNISRFIKDNVDISELKPGVSFRLGFLLKENGQLSEDYRPSPLYFSPASPENITYDNKTDTYKFVATLLFQRTTQEFNRGERGSDSRYSTTFQTSECPSMTMYMQLIQKTKV
ncbi:hypothetical protein [Thermococcus sp. JCM 11816]|uniref:hypothetical protein n=1 Tax=Thermococcus sp. (strain JCM 11816 / KS-1) TaxID=1295125 RepID=UPI0006D10521